MIIVTECVCCIPYFYWSQAAIQEVQLKKSAIPKGFLLPFPVCSWPLLLPLSPPFYFQLMFYCCYEILEMECEIPFRLKRKEIGTCCMKQQLLPNLALSFELYLQLLRANFYIEVVWSYQKKKQLWDELSPFKYPALYLDIFCHNIFCLQIIFHILVSPFI